MRFKSIIIFIMLIMLASFMIDKVVKDEVQNTIVSTNKYDHEEAFLDSLKNLKDSLN